MYPFGAPVPVQKIMRLYAEMDMRLTGAIAADAWMNP
jgi:hypothetical protein